MIKPFQLRVARLGLGFALLVGLPACAQNAPATQEANVVPAEGIPSPDAPIDDLEVDAIDDPEFDSFFDDEFDFGDEVSPNDPFERSNRSVLNFNRGLSRHVFDPIVRGYRFAVPKPARQGVHRVFTNFRTPSTLVNDLLQLRFRDAARTLGRFILNTTFGFAGIFDVAIEAGWEHHESDFGQTLGRLGVGSGPYLMLPVFGPNTVRDGFGGVVDMFFQPLTYLIGPVQNIVLGAGSSFTTLDARNSAMKALEESSVDYYAALRSAYLQHRAAHIRRSEE
jgi:phospholipid-binding lipoprotein MlaA